jgi:rubrerythrin
MTPVDALQTALAAEHAALYVYGALGARTSQSATPVLFAEVSDAYTTHRAWRDLLTSRLVDAGAEPTPAAPTYELPATAPTPRGVARAAVEVEERCAATYAYVVANTTGADRTWAISALTRSATRRVAFGSAPEPLPGAAELA